MNELPDRLLRKYIIKAIRAYDDGFPHLFKEARRYEVVFDGRRYRFKSDRGDRGNVDDRENIHAAGFLGRYQIEMRAFVD